MIDPIIIAILGSFISIIVPAIGSGYAMQKIGELSENLLNDNKNKGFFTNSLVFSVLAETPTIYGLLISIIILMTLAKGIDIVQAWTLFLSAVSVAIPGIISAYAIGLVAQASIIAIKEKANLFGKTIVLAALPEVIAVYGLIIALLIIMAAGSFGAVKVHTMKDVYTMTVVTFIISLAGIVALYIGKIAVNAVKSLISNDNAFTQALIIAVLPESLALYALILAILIMTQGKYI